MAVFNWTYFSFYEYNTTWLYRELLLIPLLVIALWFLWMKIVRNALKDARADDAMTIDELYTAALLEETEQSDLEEEEAGEAGEAKSKSDHAAMTKSDLNEPDKKND